MKNNGKSSKPIIAAHSTNTGTNPAKPGNGKDTGSRARGSRVARGKDNKIRTLVLERISDGILAFDADMNHVYVDERAGELLGREAQDLVGKSFLEAYPESTTAPFADACRRAFETQTVIPFDGYFPSSNTWFEGRVYPSNDGLSVLISDRGLPEQEDMLRTLEESEEKFSKAFHSSPIAKLIVRRRDRYILDVNQKFLTLCGLEQDQAFGTPSMELSSEWKQVVDTILQQQGSIHEHELSMSNTSGGQCYLLVSAEWMELENEPCVLIDCMDVTERKKAEEKVREISEFPLQNPNPVMRLRKDGELLYANPSSDPLLDSWKQPDGEVTPPFELEELLPVVVETGSKREIEIKHQETIYTCLLVPVQGADYVNLYFSDITSRKQAQESLQAVVHQTATGIMRTDLQGKLEFVNQAFCDMLGYSEAELIGNTMWGLIDPDDLAKNKRLFEKMAVSGESFQVETRILRHNGTVLWVSIGTSPLRDASRQTYSAVSVIVDITRRKRAEESLMDSARRTLYLSALSDLLRPLSAPEQIEMEATRILGMQLRADRVMYATILSDGTATRRKSHPDSGADETAEFHIRQYIPGEILPRFRAGRAFVSSGMSSRSENSDNAVTAQAQIIIPLIQDDELVAALFVQQFEPRQWKNEEIHLVEETADRMQTAIDRARAEQEQRESELRFRILSDTVPSMVWSTAPDGTVRYLNEYWHNFTGLTTEETIANWAKLVLHPDDYESYTAAWKEALATTPDEYVDEARYRRNDGEYRWFQSRAIPVRDDHGNVTAWYGVTTDIHDRVEKQAELTKVINNTLFIMARCSRDLRYRFISRAYAKMINRAPEDVVGKPMAEIMGEAGLKTILPYVEQVLQGKQVEFETEVPILGVGAPALHVIYSPDYDEEGNVVGWFASIMDVTARKLAELEKQQMLEREQTLRAEAERSKGEAEQELSERKQAEDAARLENERFLRFIDSNIIGIVVGDANGKILLANDYYLNLLGVTRQHFIEDKVDWKKFTPSEWLPADDKAIRELRERGICEPYEKEYIRTDGSRVPVYIANARLPGPKEEIAAFILDMTERKQAENRLALLGEISELARRFEDPIELMASVAQVVGRHFQVKRCLFNEIDLDHDLETVHRDYHDGIESVEGRHKITEYSSITTSEMMAGKTVVNYDSKTDPRTANDYERSYLSTGERTYVAVPLMRDDRWVASLWISDDRPRQWSREEVSVLETIAERTWTATERLRVDAALRESQQRLSLTYNHAAIGLVETTPDTRMLEFNDAFLRILGFTREELLGHSFLDITYQEDAKIENTLYHQLMSQQIPFYRLEKHFIKKDGTLTWCEMVRSVVLDGNGKPRFGIGAVFDINDRKQREEALRARTEEIETLMEVSPIGILVAHDREGNEITGNPAAYSILGFPAHSTENLSKPRMDEMIPSQSHRVFRAGVELMGDQLPMQMSARLGMEIEEQELELRFEDGTVKYIYLFTKPLFDREGNTRGAVAAMLDITERRRNEEALKAARANAEETASRIARLQQVTAALSAPLTPSQVPEIVVKQGVPALDAAVGTMMELTMDGQALEIRYSTLEEPLVEHFQHSPLSLHTPATDAVQSGKIVWIESRQAYLERYPHLADQISRWKYQSALSIPMEYKGHTVGVLNMSFDSIKPYNREDEEYALTLARQSAQAFERARAEESLRASEERYRAIINQTTVGILRKDAEGNMVFVNQAFCEMLGYNSSELIDKSIWELTYPEDIERNRELYSQMMRDALPFRIEKRLIHRDGSIIWVLVSVSPMLDSNGRPQSAVSVYSDITLRKYAESELHRLNLELEDRVQLRTAQLQAANESLLESEATSRLIIESMPDGIVIINKEGQVVYCNAQVETLFGYKPTEVLGQSVTQLIPERYQQALGLERELFGQRKDQTQFPADVLVSPISSRTTWDRMITVRDTTEQRLAQEAIRKNEEKLRSLFEVLPVGISFLDHEGNVTEMNSTLTQILGLNKQEIAAGKFRPRRYVRADGSPMHPREFASVRARQEQKPVYNVETGILKENGQTIWTSINAAPVDVAGVDVVVATIDITARKQVENELHKSRERLRILSRRLVEVQEEERRAIARELHDRVGQNLAALNLNLNILRSQLSAEALQVIGTRLSDSVTLVNQILGITRNVMADLRSDVLDEYGLESAVREYADQFTQRTGIQVVSDKSSTAIPRLDPSIEMTLLRIAQEALTNVARHARANRATISIGADEEAVYMSIQDDGVGILSWQKANQPGSHGLRIIRERAEAFGGSVQVHSAYKKGTNIEVKIPLGGSSYKSPREMRS